MHAAPIIRRVWVRRADAEGLERLADSYYPVEVGGILAGYVNEESAVVTEIVGPGPQAQHSHDSFLPDHDYQTNEMHRIFRASGGSAVYLGDWHTHPDGPVALSPLDIRTMRTIAEDHKAHCPNPLMLLLAREEGAWTMRAFCLVSTRKPPFAVEAVPILLF